MSVDWKEIGSRAKPRNWPPLAWAMLVLLFAGIIGTAIVGIELFDVTRQPMMFNTR